MNVIFLNSDSPLHPITKCITITNYPSVFVIFITLTLFTSERYVILLTTAVHGKVVEYGVPRPRK